MGLRSALDRWASRQDATTLDVLGSASVWLQATVVVLVIVAVGAWIPTTAEHLQLEAGAALAAFALPAAGGFGLALSHQRGRPYSRLEVFSALWTSSTLQLFCAVLIARSSMTGSVIFSPILLFTAASHGFTYRATASEPFPTLGTAFATVAGMAMCRSFEQALLLGICGALGVLTSLWLGTLATRAELNRERRARMREAITAQQLHDQMTQVRVLSDSLVDVMGSAHDMANALSLVHLSTDLVSTLKDALPSDRRPVLERAEHSLRTSTRNIERMLADMREGRGAVRSHVPPQMESVALAGIAREVVHSAARRFPNASIEADVSEDRRVDVAGGPQTLRRILENLVLNGLQGDGVRGADRVVLRSTLDERTGTHLLVVEDEGPGFPEDLLSRPIAAFSSTKDSGTGLGLYTVERLVTASGGILRLENRPEGGARVTVALRGSTKGSTR